MDRKVDLSELKQPGTYLSVDEKVTLELATEFEKEKDPDYVSISWASQKRAMDYFNEHGFLKTLSLLTEMRGEQEEECLSTDG